jgi:hypothetical protein
MSFRSHLSAFSGLTRHRLSRFFVPFRSLCSWCRTSVLCFHIMATNRLLRLRFEAISICCLSLGTSFGATTELGRIVLPANSATQTTSAGLQKLSGRNALLYIPMDHAEPLPLLVLLHKLQSGLAGAGHTRLMRTKDVSLLLRRNRPAKAGAPDPNNGVTTIWRSIALWKKRLPAARSIAVGLQSVDSPTARRTRFRLAWPTATCSATSSHFHRDISLGRRRVEDQGPRAWKYRWYTSPTANQIMSCQLPRRVAYS